MLEYENLSGDHNNFIELCEQNLRFPVLIKTDEAASSTLSHYMAICCTIVALSKLLYTEEKLKFFILFIKIEVLK